MTCKPCMFCPNLTMSFFNGDKLLHSILALPGCNRSKDGDWIVAYGFAVWLCPWPELSSDLGGQL